MKTTTTSQQANFSLKTIYKGKQMDLNIVANDDKYSVLENDKTIGHIKLGNDRHTWIVVDSFYVAPQLVNEIARSIAA
jgi:hypothetical protein